MARLQRARSPKFGTPRDTERGWSSVVRIRIVVSQRLCWIMVLELTDSMPTWTTLGRGAYKRDYKSISRYFHTNHRLLSAYPQPTMPSYPIHTPMSVETNFSSTNSTGFVRLKRLIMNSSSEH